MGMARILVAVILCFTACSSSAAWEYKSKKSEMTDEVSKFAWTISKNKLNFSFPYSGGAEGRLVLRYVGDDPAVIVEIRKGQFICHSGCTVLIRFDDQAAERWDASGPKDASSTMIFLENETELMKRLLHAKRLRVQATFYNEGEQVLDFNLVGLKWSVLEKKEPPPEAPPSDTPPDK